jgi:pullulanase
MVQALNQAGLRGGDGRGLQPHQRLRAEREVGARPGRARLLPPPERNGNVETSTCCANTATEHAMMEKLMVDSLLTWARDYKVDGFRFDLMGHHMVATCSKGARRARRLTPARDGVDGGKIYIYGEGWNFGEVADNAPRRERHPAQHGRHRHRHLQRPAARRVRGGGPFGGLQEQGFITGLYTTPTKTLTRRTQRSQTARPDRLDPPRPGRQPGRLPASRAPPDLVTGQQSTTTASPAGYTLDPQENIVRLGPR